mgnify:CR=1 FL=1
MDVVDSIKLLRLSFPRDPSNGAFYQADTIVRFPISSTGRSSIHLSFYRSSQLLIATLLPRHIQRTKIFFTRAWFASSGPSLVFSLGHRVYIYISRFVNERDAPLFRQRFNNYQTIERTANTYCSQAFDCQGSIALSFPVERNPSLIGKSWQFWCPWNNLVGNDMDRISIRSVTDTEHRCLPAIDRKLWHD